MTPSNPLFALITFSICLLTGFLIHRGFKLKAAVNRFETIDGLRGFLAISVFIHHSNVWYNYLQSDVWQSPDSRLFAQLGQTGVTLFFMISSFLFVNKLLEFKYREFNWQSFFVKRFFRLVPLHFFVVSIIFFLVFLNSNWMIHSSYFGLLKSILRWFGFGLIGLGDINEMDASIINAGVLWSLSYEWLLYFSLPIVALLVKNIKPSLFYVVIGAGFIAIVVHFKTLEWHHMLSFLGGAIAPIVLKYNTRKINFNHPIFSLLIVVLLLLTFSYFSSTKNISKLFVSIVFTLVALGNDFFGILRKSTLKFLGDISYSTYLCHGIILYVGVNYVWGIDQLKQFSSMQYMLFVFTIAPVVVLSSFVTFYFVEKPFMKIGQSITIS